MFTCASPSRNSSSSGAIGSSRNRPTSVYLSCHS